MSTVTASLWHDCTCGASFGLDSSRPSTASDLAWWLEELARHEACAVTVCGIWNDQHDCLREAGHPGDHWCGGWDLWRVERDRLTPSVGCGDVWNRDEYEAEDCADPYFLSQRPDLEERCVEQDRARERVSAPAR